MTTLLQAPLPGADHFTQNTLDSPSYSTISYEPSLDYHSSRPAYPYRSDQRYYSSTPSRGYDPPASYTYHATQPSSKSSLSEESDDDHGDMDFPSFGSGTEEQSITIKSEPSQKTTAVSSTPHDADLPSKVNDDQAVQIEPTQHVDYLSHEWREEDIWASWSYVVKRRQSIANCTRLENASWRQWIKTKKNLKTVSPESLNWLKDCDVTWLYGPLQVGSKSLTTVTPPPSRMSHHSSFINKKSNLKKKSASAVMLERSRSQQSLLQRVSDIIEVQKASSPAGGRPAFKRHCSAFTLSSSRTNTSVAPSPAEQEGEVSTSSRTPYSYSETPTPAECKHVLFDEEVKQVQAVESDDDTKQEPEEVAAMESDEDDDGGLMMAPALRSKLTTPRSSFSNDNKTIVPLPSTTLKYRTDTPEPPEIQTQSGLWSGGRKLSPSPSQETLRPPRPSHNFLLDDDPEVSDEPWKAPSQDASYEPGPGLRRTESGMFMPYDEDDGPPRNSIFGQALNAVNTFKDIAHVVWNVGWYKSTDNH